MTANNPFVAAGRELHGVSEAQYVERAKRLAQVATLGYHGHFLIDPLNPERLSSQMRDEQFNHDEFKTQMLADLQWFKEHGLAHHGVYSAGWWFMNETVLSSLIENGFKNDFSFSYDRFSLNPYSVSFLEQNQIAVGESFKVQSAGKIIECTQTLMDCHASPFFQDFVRNLNRLLEGRSGRVRGALYSHDYDLQSENTLKCIEQLAGLKSVRFLGFDELSFNEPIGALKTFSLR